MPSIVGLEPRGELFDRFFAIEKYSSQLKIPKEMRPWVQKTFGSVGKVLNQKIVRVQNNFTFESALFNELRAKRPMVKGRKDWQKVIEYTRGGPFGKVLKNTPEDVFGRVKGKHSKSASNVAKYDKWHGLIVFNEHDPLKFTQQEINDYLETSKKWLARAHKRDSNAKFPFLLWNCLWKSSASVIHGHMQILLARKQHYSGVQFLNKVRQDYRTKYRTDYFEDFFRAHKDLGLAFQKGSVKVIANLTPRKEKEVIIIAPSISIMFGNALYKVLKTFRDDLSVESFNVGLMFPPLTNESGWEGFPVVARVVDRGSLSTKTSDIGGMELYAGTAVVSSDPYVVVKNLKKNF